MKVCSCALQAGFTYSHDNKTKAGALSLNIQMEKQFLNMCNCVCVMMTCDTLQILQLLSRKQGFMPLKILKTTNAISIRCFTLFDCYVMYFSDVTEKRLHYYRPRLFKQWSEIFSHLGSCWVRAVAVGLKCLSITLTLHSIIL